MVIALLFKLLVSLILNMSRPLAASAARAVATKATWPTITSTSPLLRSPPIGRPANRFPFVPRHAFSTASPSQQPTIVDPYSSPNASTSPPASPSSPSPSSSPTPPSRPPTTPPSSSSSSQSTTHFGYTDVPVASKESLVSSVFHRVASTYDMMNDLMSLGIHRVWKHRLISLVHPTPHTQLLDVAGGTGDIAFRFIDEVNSLPLSPYERAAAATPAMTAAVTVCDINPSMLAVGKERAVQYGYLPSSPTSPSPYPSPSLRVGLQFVEGNAESLPFADGSFDCYTIAFGLRNVTDPAKALREAVRVLKVGGVFHCLEFSRLSYGALQRLYDGYSFSVIPVMGEVVAGDRASYQYLVESIRKWYGQEELAEVMRAAGMVGVRYENLSMGIAAIHTGYRL